MSILIKKMEMPKGCWACPFAVGKLYECLFTKKSSNWGLTTRPSDCPLIEVKSPHGRLIDADALHNAMYHRAFETDGDTMWQSGCWVRYRAIEQVHDSQPTIIEAEGSGK